MNNRDTISAAIETLKKRTEAEMLWRAKAINLLVLLSDSVVNGHISQGLIDRCKEHAEAGFEL